MGFNPVYRTLLGAGLSLLCLGGVEGALKSPDSTHKPTFTFNELWNLEKTFWDSFLYPANVNEMQGNKSAILASDVRLFPIDFENNMCKICDRELF